MAEPSGWHHLGVRLDGDNITVLVDGKPYMEADRGCPSYDELLPLRVAYDPAGSLALVVQVHPGGKVDVLGEWWVTPPAHRPTPSEPIDGAVFGLVIDHGEPAVVQKTRHPEKGLPVTSFYAIGPNRPSREEAEADLVRFRQAPPQWHGPGKVGDIETFIKTNPEAEFLTLSREALDSLVTMIWEQNRNWEAADRRAQQIALERGHPAQIAGRPVAEVVEAAMNLSRFGATIAKRDLREALDELLARSPRVSADAALRAAGDTIRQDDAVKEAYLSALRRLGLLTKD